MIHHTMSWLPRVNLQKINGKKELFEFANKKKLHHAEFITIKINLYDDNQSIQMQLILF